MSAANMAANLQCFVLNILQKTKGQTELMQSFVRCDDFNDESEGPGELIAKPPELASTNVPSLPDISKGIMTNVPKRDIYTPCDRRRGVTFDHIPDIDLGDPGKNQAQCEGPCSGMPTSKTPQKVKDKRQTDNKQNPNVVPNQTKYKRGNKKKKKAILGEEIYTDKDRAAAAVMGSKDIKLSLSMKMKQERTSILTMPEEMDPAIFIALGVREMRNGGDPVIAREFINKALDLNPRDKNALVARSQCYIALGECKLALEDAETALKYDKNFIKAIYQKAEALFHLGQFEHSLMYYHRGLRIRPELQQFRLGVQKAQEAIENTIGDKINLAKSNKDTDTTNSKSLHSSTNKKDVRSSLDFNKNTVIKNVNDENQRRASQISMLSQLGKFNLDDNKNIRVCSDLEHNVDKRLISSRASSIRFSPTSDTSGSEKNKTKNTSRPKTTAGKNRFLGNLTKDKAYFEKLVNHPDMKCFDKENTSITIKAKEAVTYLENRQEFWKQQMPATRPG